MSSRMKNTECFDVFPIEDDAIHIDGVDIDVSAFLRHCAILGASGSGKTVAAKVLCEEFALRGIPVIAVDPQGDIASLMTIGNMEEVSNKGGDLTAYRLFRDKVDVKVWTPASNAGIPVCVNPLELDFDGDSIRKISMVSQNIASLLGYDLRKDSGKFTAAFFDMVLSYIYSKKIDIKDFAKLSKFIVNIPDALLDDVSDVLNPNEIKDIVRKIKLLTIGSKSLLFGNGTALDIPSLLGIESNKPRISVIYLNTLASQEEKNFFVSQLALTLYSWMMDNPSDAIQAVFYIDEIAPFLPPTSKPASKDILRLLFKQARKYGIGCILASQNPGDVDYKSMAQISTYFLGRIMTDQDVKKVDQVIKALTPDYKAVTSSLPKLKVGNFKLISPDVSRIENVKFRWLYSTHSTYDESDLEELVNKELDIPLSTKPKRIATPRDYELSHTLLPDDEVKLLMPVKELQKGVLTKHSPFNTDYVVVGEPSSSNIHVYMVVVFDDIMYCGKYGITYVTKRNRYKYYPLSKIKTPLFLRVFIDSGMFMWYIRPSMDLPSVFVSYSADSTFSSFDAFIKYGITDRDKIESMEDGDFVDYENPIYVNYIENRDTSNTTC